MIYRWSKKVLKSSTPELFKAHLIPEGLRPQLFKENVFAVGDTGGLVYPISGKGIPYAMSSGQIAIESIKVCENKDVLEKIARTLKQFLALWEKYRSSEIVRRGLI